MSLRRHAVASPLGVRVGARNVKRRHLARRAWEATKSATGRVMTAARKKPKTAIAGALLAGALGAAALGSHLDKVRLAESNALKARISAFQKARVPNAAEAASFSLSKTGRRYAERFDRLPRNAQLKLVQIAREAFAEFPEKNVPDSEKLVRTIETIVENSDENPEARAYELGNRASSYAKSNDRIFLAEVPRLRRAEAVLEKYGAFLESIGSGEKRAVQGTLR